MIAVKLLTDSVAVSAQRFPEYTWSIYVHCALMESLSTPFRRVSFSSCLHFLCFCLYSYPPVPDPMLLPPQSQLDLCQPLPVPLSSDSPTQNTAEHLLRIYRKISISSPLIKTIMSISGRKKKHKKLEMQGNYTRNEAF